MNKPNDHEPLIRDLLDEIKELRACMKRAQEMLEVPAAEYVPALKDAWEELHKGLLG